MGANCLTPPATIKTDSKYQTNGNDRMTEAERQEFKQMATDVAVMKHSQEKIVEPALEQINNKLDALSFYTKEETDKKLEIVERNFSNKIITIQKRRWYENTISALIGAVLTSIVVTFVNKILNN